MRRSRPTGPRICKQADRKPKIVNGRCAKCGAEAQKVVYVAEYVCGQCTGKWDEVKPCGCRFDPNRRVVAIIPNERISTED